MPRQPRSITRPNAFLLVSCIVLVLIGIGVYVLTMYANEKDLTLPKPTTQTPPNTTQN